MENWVYLLKTSTLITLFWLIYSFFIQKESFKEFNRFFLLLGIGLSFGLPLYVFTETEVIVLQETAFLPVDVSFESTTQGGVASSKDSFNLLPILGFIYWTGVLFMAVKLLLQLFGLRKLIKICKKEEINGIRHYLSPKPIAPFSFFKAVVYHKESYNAESLDLILTHEQEHISQRHSLDLIIANLIPMLLWFLPFAYAYRKAINENLEYLADAGTLVKIDNKKQYQYTLINTCTAPEPKILAHFFFSNSSLKKRIMHINQSKSAQIKKLKSIVVLPFLLGFVYFFQVETLAMYVPSDAANVSINYQEETKSAVDSTNGTASNNAIQQTITKETTDEELAALVKNFKEIMDVDVTISEVTRNSKGHITIINIQIEDKNTNFKTERRVVTSLGILPILVQRKNVKIADEKDYFIQAIDKSDYPKGDETSVIFNAVQGKKDVFFNGKKLDLNKKNAFKSYEIEKEDAEQIFLRGEFIGSFESLSELSKKLENNSAILVLSKVRNGDANSSISVIHIGDKIHENANAKDINAYQKTLQLKAPSGLFSGLPSLMRNPIMEEENVLFLVDEKEVEKDKVARINSETIENIEVIKDQQAIKQYTEKDVVGVVSIKLNELAPPSPPTPPAASAKEEESTLIKAEKIELGNGMKLYGDPTFSFDKSENNLYFLDGKKMKDKDLDNLLEKGAKFKRIVVISDEKEIKKHTNKKVNRVILLETK